MTAAREETMCRLCGSAGLKQLLANCKTDCGDSYCLLQCPTCSFVTTDTVPSKETLGQFYNENYWHKDKAASNGALGLFLSLRIRPVLNRIKKLAPPPARVLDWGAGDGRLLETLTRAGYDSWGIDVYCDQPGSPRLKNTTIEECDWPEEFFDIITCIHVLEHVENPLRSVERALRLLRPNGTLVLEVPNIESLSFKIFGKRWQPLEIPTHLNHFTLKSLRKLFSTHGNATITEFGTFSHRVSPSSIVLSIFPAMAPRTVRKAYGNKYPFVLMLLFFVMQLVAYPFAMVESALKRGAVIRVHVRKAGQG